MLSLPPGFDFNLFISDFFYVSAPFVAIAFTFTVYAVIKKIARML